MLQPCDVLDCLAIDYGIVVGGSSVKEHDLAGLLL